jgi:hypothetical protein
MLLGTHEVVSMAAGAEGRVWARGMGGTAGGPSMLISLEFCSCCNRIVLCSCASKATPRRSVRCVRPALSPLETQSRLKDISALVILMSICIMRCLAFCRAVWEGEVSSSGRKVPPTSLPWRTVEGSTMESNGNP